MASFLGFLYYLDVKKVIKIGRSKLSAVLDYAVMSQIDLHCITFVGINESCSVKSIFSTLLSLIA